MVAVVIIINVLISLILIYIARYLWTMKRKLGLIADSLTVYERATFAGLNKAPANIANGNESIKNLHTRQQQIQIQIQQIQQILSLVALTRKFGWDFYKKLSLKRRKKAATWEIRQKSHRSN